MERHVVGCGARYKFFLSSERRRIGSRRMQSRCMEMLIAFLVFSCNDGADNLEYTSGTDDKCDPGETQPCVCEDDDEGSQKCSNKETWNKCKCETASTDMDIDTDSDSDVDSDSDSDSDSDADADGDTDADMTVDTVPADTGGNCLPDSAAAVTD